VKRKLEEEEEEEKSSRDKEVDLYAPFSETIMDEGEAILGHVSLVVNLRITDGIHYRNVFTCF